MSDNYVTACLDCQHHIQMDNSMTWYHHECEAAAKLRQFDCLTGVTTWHRQNCRDVNIEGACPLFALRERSK